MTIWKDKICQVDLESNPQNFLLLTQDLPVVGPRYDWNNFDKAYLDYGNYISASSTSEESWLQQSFSLPPAEMSYHYDKASDEYGDYISKIKYQKSNIKNGEKNSLFRTGGFFGTFGFFGKKGNIEEKYSQKTHKSIEDKISLSSAHYFSPFPLAKKYGNKSQNITVKTIPTEMICQIRCQVEYNFVHFSGVIRK